MRAEPWSVLLLLAHASCGDYAAEAPSESPSGGGPRTRGHAPSPHAAVGEAVASEFERHVPALSDSLLAELAVLRDDIARRFDSLRDFVGAKLERMQRDAPGGGSPGLGEVSAAHTPAATIRHNLAMAELRRLGADLTRAMEEAVGGLRQEFRASLDQLREQVRNSSSGLADRLEGEFAARSEESTNVLKKVFFLTRSQMALVRSQLSNISSALNGQGPPGELPPPSSTAATAASTATATTAATATATRTTEVPTTEAHSTTQHDSTTSTTTAAIPTTTTEPEWLPKDCLEAQEAGYNSSGVTTIRAAPGLQSQRVWCEQEKDGGGWTVVLLRRRQPEQVDFRRDWDDYSQGFGSPEGEYWIGLETLYLLTKGNPYSLRVDMTWENEDATSLYDYFSVGPSRFGRRGYELNVGGFNESSTGGDAMAYHNGMDFSTYDEDNDGASGGSCSEWSGGGGWWYNYCYYSNPTGIYPPPDLPENTEVDHLLEWRKWQGYYTYLSSLVMMIRPN